MGALFYLDSTKRLGFPVHKSLDIRIQSGGRPFRFTEVVHFHFQRGLREKRR